jgi:methylisocitrate lyase
MRRAFMDDFLMTGSVAIEWRDAMGKKIKVERGGNTQSEQTRVAPLAVPHSKTLRDVSGRSRSVGGDVNFGAVIQSGTGSAGERFRRALEQERPLQIAGVINAYTAILAEKTGFRALYLSGAGVANASYGLPDLGMTSLSDVLEDVRRITAASRLPLLVDADTGWGEALGIQRTTREMIRAGAAGIHLEDQVAEKRCGHRPGKELVSAPEMCDRIKAAVDAKTDPEFVVMARTDAAAAEGVAAAIERARAYREAGADMIFAEALTSLEEYKTFCQALDVPVLANMTEFGKTPLFTVSELASAGVALALYPLSGFRAMSAAALEVFGAIRNEGTQRGVIGKMQTREELYNYLDYHAYEEKLDRLFAAKKKS